MFRSNQNVSGKRKQFFGLCLYFWSFLSRHSKLSGSALGNFDIHSKQCSSARLIGWFLSFRRNQRAEVRGNYFYRAWELHREPSIFGQWHSRLWFCDHLWVWETRVLILLIFIQCFILYLLIFLIFCFFRCGSINIYQWLLPLRQLAQVQIPQ